MSIVTVIAYVLKLLAVLISITSIPIVIVGGLLARLSGREFLPLSSLIGAIASWAFVAFLWNLFEGGNIPIAALASAVCLLFIHGHLARNSLTSSATRMMAAEAWGIIVVALVIVFSSPVVRWY